MSGHCRDCEWWDPLDDDTDPFGVCWLAASIDGHARESASLAYAIDGEGYAAALRTRAEFGCVQFEAREERRVTEPTRKSV